MSELNDTKFTPGPWVAHPTETAIDGSYAHAWVETKSGQLCTLAQTNRNANAHLIAAAPELYAALQATAGYLADRTISDIELWELVEPALRKARGEMTAEEILQREG